MLVTVVDRHTHPHFIYKPHPILEEENEICVGNWPDPFQRNKWVKGLTRETSMQVGGVRQPSMKAKVTT